MSEYVSQQVTLPEGTVTFTWMPCPEEDLAKYQPVTQAYGICFEDQNWILLINEGEDGGWKIPGGTPEEGETLQQTLERELMEEADMKIKDVRLLGVQKVEEKDKVYYQARFICRVAELMPQTIDPAKGVILPRKFVPIEEINEWVNWGITGRALFADAISAIKM